ncbi:pentatricopeptide repeat-containing protein At1g05750, chloroplastic [Malania oleifera]|uniref:pentatricopeptide repeat-containing protein At1g05750, chloroplastic n=1 Tax=Malania oleifera TaxID=397392 RepID=UPI0025ADC30C|nr:pentatricopeptide repeat-containing protein At1g05750, chloroplastic [Malania oleifera]
MSLAPYAAATTQLSPPPKPPTIVPHPNQPSFPNLSGTKTKDYHPLKHSNTPIDPTVLWTSSIARNCRNGRLAEAVAEFVRMRMAEVEPNHITFLTLLSGCADFPAEAACLGASVHACVCKLGLVVDNVMVGTALVDMYSKCSRVDLAQLVFDDMRVKNLVSWNTMIDGCMRNGRIEDAIILFAEMPQRNTISWTALIGGFVKKGQFEHALEWFHEMQLSGVEPDYVTIISILAACAHLGTLGLGLWLHRFILQKDFRDNIRIMNSLIDMYSRCGCIELAHQVFDRMSTRSLVSWNSIIVGFAANGYAEEALEFFDMMQREGFKPNEVSFTGALTACSHAGLVDKGLWLFNIMKKIHKICPRIEHYGCMADLYSRAGRLEDALHIIKSMPMKPNEVALGSLLAACRTHGDVGLAEKLMSHLVELDPGVDSNYVLLSNIYAAVGRWHGASKVRNTMKALGIQKKPGLSSIEIDCCIHDFLACDKSHDDTEQIYAMLKQLSLELRICGYVPGTTVYESYGHD